MTSSKPAAWELIGAAQAAGIPTYDKTLEQLAAIYTTVEPPTPTQSYKICEWKNCRTYVLAVVYDLPAGEAHGACDRHVQDVRQFVESIYPQKGAAG